MDTTQLLADAKARFSHNSAKAYLKDKYSSNLIVAEQGGLWTASTALISFLSSIDQEYVVIVDNFDNPVRVNVSELRTKIVHTYTTVMDAWEKEWAELETKR